MLRERYNSTQVFTLLATSVALLFAIVTLLLAIDQERVLESSERLQSRTVPEIIRFQRLARNLDLLRQEGERVFSSATSEGRQQALFLTMLVASHPSILEHPQAATAAREAEAFLVETSRLATENPASIAARYPQWQQFSKRLNLQVDDILVEGANLATADLGAVAAAMRLTRYKLMGATVVVGGLLVLLLVLLRRYLLRPLQRIDRALSTLSVDHLAPEFPDTRLAEIHAVEEATKRLHGAMMSNDAVRRELEVLANRDDLTGLMNRRHFMESAKSELRRAQRYDRPIAVAIGDLDSFKNLNDTYGHDGGDVVLRSFARLLAESLRESDLVCRYGGEEFAFLLPESTVEQAQVLLDRFRERCAGHEIWPADGVPVRITLSIGLADASHCPIRIALQQADRALYEAKRQGRNRVVIASDAG